MQTFKTVFKIKQHFISNDDNDDTDTADQPVNSDLCSGSHQQKEYHPSLWSILLHQVGDVALIIIGIVMIILVTAVMITSIFIIIRMSRYLMWTSPSTGWRTRTSNQTRNSTSSLSASLGERAATKSSALAKSKFSFLIMIRSVPAAWLIFTLIVLLIYLLTRCIFVIVLLFIVLKRLDHDNDDGRMLSFFDDELNMINTDHD